MNEPYRVLEYRVSWESSHSAGVRTTVECTTQAGVIALVQTLTRDDVRDVIEICIQPHVRL